MKFNQAIELNWIADFIGAEILGELENKAFGINEIHKVAAGDITFVDNEKYYNKALHSPASIIIIDKATQIPEGKTLLITPHPFDAYNNLVKKFRVFEPQEQAISEDVIIGANTKIQPGVFIGRNCKIGNNCIIHANVSIYDHVNIGDNVIIHSGAIIGSEAFYYKVKKDLASIYTKMESCGSVFIEDEVEIGAGTTIDKGVSGATIIGAGTKIDNQVHIGHGTVIGKNCLIAAQVGIAGKVIIEDNVTLWGQVGVNKDLRIGKGSVVYAQSGVPGDLAAGKNYFGSPAVEAKQMMRQLGWIKRIPEIWQLLVERESIKIEKG